MTDDLRTLAAEAIRELRGRYGPLGDGSLRSGSAGEIADAVLAAVLPAHRRQVLEEAADALAAYAGNYPEDVFPADSDSRDAISGTAMRHAYGNAARIVRELAAAAPQTGPTSTVPVETAPAVPEVTPNPSGTNEAPQPTDPDVTVERVDDLTRRIDQKIQTVGSDAAARRALPAIWVLVLELSRCAALAIAHDRQPYPTVDAYEQACDALHKHRERADRAEAERDSARDALAAANAAIDEMRPVVETAKALAAAAWNSTAPRTPIFQAFLDAVAALTATDSPPFSSKSADEHAEDGHA